MITEDPGWAFVAIFVPLDGTEIFEAHAQKIFCLEPCFNLRKWSQTVLKCISKSLKTYKSEMEDSCSSKYISVLNGLILLIFSHVELRHFLPCVTRVFQWQPENLKTV